MNQRTHNPRDRRRVDHRSHQYSRGKFGADKEVITDAGPATRPNIAVRVGAILALERLVKQNGDVHCQIMEILCSYIREETSGNADYETRHAEKPLEDIQIVLTFVGRRS